MKCVCISCFNYYEIRMKAVIDYYCSNGYEVTYIISDFDHYTKQRYIADYENTIQIKVPEYHKNISIMRLLSHWVFSNKIYKKLFAIKPDLIYCMFPPNSLVKYISKYKDKAKCKIIFDCYDMWPESFPYEKHSKLLKVPFGLWKNLRNEYINNADLLLCVSEVSRNALMSVTENIPIQILKPSIKKVNVDLYNSDIKEGLTFCYLGNVNHITDVKLGVALLSALAKHVRVSVHFIGEGENIKDFILKLKNNGVQTIQHGVIFDIVAKEKIFKCCNLGLNIPRREIQSSMSLKSIEYMCVGLPFLNSGIGDTYYFVENNKIGINISYPRFESTVLKILSLTSKELTEMHINCIELYKDKFLKQNYKEILAIKNQELRV